MCVCMCEDSVWVVSKYVCVCGGGGRLCAYKCGYMCSLFLAHLTSQQLAKYISGTDVL